MLKFIVPTGSERNIRNFGAVGDGNTDDTDAIQSAIDSAIEQRYQASTATRSCLGPVKIPSGVYRITRPLKIHSVMGFRLSGDGSSSVIHPTGQMESVFDINGAAWCEWDRFRIDGGGNAEVGDVISLEYESDVVSRTTSQCRFQNIEIMNFKSFINGFNIGRNSGNHQVDCSYFQHCSVGGNWKSGDTKNFQNAFLIGSGIHGNNLCHMLNHPIVSGCRYLIHGNGSLPLTVLGGSFGGAESVLFWQSAGPATFIGGRSEVCERLYIDNNATSWDSSVIFQNFQFVGDSLHKDGRVIIWNTGGRLKLDGVQFTTTRPGVPPTIQVSPYAALDVTLEGVYSTADSRDIIKVAGGSKDNLRVNCVGYRKIDKNGKANFN